MYLQKVSRTSNYAWDAELLRRTLAVDDVEAVGANVATFYMAYPVGAFKEYKEYARDGKVCYTPVSAMSDNVECAEQKLMKELDPAFKKGAVVIWVFSERQPCGPELHNCHDMLSKFEGLTVYYVHDYPHNTNRSNPIKRRTNTAVQKFGKMVQDKVRDEIDD